MRTLIHICALMFALGCDDSMDTPNHARIELEAGRTCGFDHDCESGVCVFGKMTDGNIVSARRDSFGELDKYCSMTCVHPCVDGFECAESSGETFDDLCNEHGCIPDPDRPAVVRNDGIAICLATQVQIGEECSSSIECKHACYQGKCDAGACTLLIPCREPYVCTDGGTGLDRSVRRCVVR